MRFEQEEFFWTTCSHFEAIDLRKIFDHAISTPVDTLPETSGH